MDFIYERIKAERMSGKTPQQIVGNRFFIQTVIDFLSLDTTFKPFIPELLKDTASLKVTIKKIVYSS